MESENSSQEKSNINTLCIGCYYGSLGQLAHMKCPDGCLHDKDDCSYCDTSNEDSNHSDVEYSNEQ